MTVLDASKEQDGKLHLLLAASGSVATIKIPEIAKALSRHQDKLSIRIIFTEAAKSFLGGQSNEQPTLSSLSEIPGVSAVYDDASEWAEPWTRGAPILHIEARRWADVLAIAPLDANTLAKIVNGFSDNLLTSVVRAWDTDGIIDGKKKIIMVAPAMNTAMWEHPITAKQIKVLEDDWGIKEDFSQPGWFKVLRPRETTLACGDTGNGAMMEWPKIVAAIEKQLGL
jgi:phosphopantothenoylcysteine decarboxylase